MTARQPAAQRGVFVILFAVLLVAILALAGLALDIGNVYARHADIKNYANAAALAAAHALDGTADGVATAVEAAQDRVQGNTWGVEQSAAWNDDALTFGTSPDGAWLAAADVLALGAAQIRRYRYARVDAAMLDSDMATVLRIFPYGGGLQGVLSSVVAVAGPTMAQILPLAVCAMNHQRTASRPVHGLSGTLELVEHGFRRGVTYNLLRLNPDGTSPANFVVNPVDFPDAGGSASSANFAEAAVAPFVCAGTILQPASDRLYVRQPFPASLAAELNSRFGQASSCNPAAALPDRNVKDFTLASWLNNKSGAAPRPHAAESTAGGRLATVADIDPPDPTGLAREDYGTVWAFARAVRYSAFAANHTGSTFSRNQLANLYPAATGSLASTWGDYPALLPYLSSTAAVYQAPGGDILRYRRILHVPLLDCPVTGDEATVLAVGKFMLAAPASSDAANPVIAAEFGGLVGGSGGAAETRLYQ